MKIQIDTDSSNYVEKLWYEYNSLLELIRFMSHSDFSKEDKDYYIQKLQEAYTQLEIAKNKVVKEYVKVPYTSYSFDFENCSLMVEGLDEKK